MEKQKARGKNGMDSSIGLSSWQEILKRSIFFLTCCLFCCLGLNHFVYPPLYTAAFASLLLLLDWLWRHRHVASMFALLLPVLLVAYIGLTPGNWFKDAPIATMMGAAFIVGLGGAIFYSKRLIWLYGLLSLTLSLCFFYALISGFPGKILWNSHKLKLFYYHPGIMALVCVWCVLYLFINRKDIPDNHWKKIFYISIALNLIILALSGSRSAYIGCAFSALATGFLYYRKYMGRIFFCGLAGFICVYLVLPEPEQDRILSLLRNPLQDATFQSRLPIWEVALAGIKDSPFVGNAQRQFYAYNRSYQAQNLEGMKKRYRLIEKPVGHPHNIYLGILFMSGIIGLLLWLAAYLPAIRWALEQNDKFFIAFLLFFMAYGLSDFPLYQKNGALVLFFPLGIVYGRRLLKMMPSRTSPEPLSLSRTEHG